MEHVEKAWQTVNLYRNRRIEVVTAANEWNERGNPPHHGFEVGVVDAVRAEKAAVYEYYCTLQDTLNGRD